MIAGRIRPLHDVSLVWRLFCLAGLGAVTCSGCGGGPELAPASGTVAVQGTPLTHGSILFEPVGHEGEIAVGQIQEDSSFKLTTFETGDGAIVGKYTVAISQRSEKVAPGQRPYNFGSEPGAFEVVSGEDNKFTIDIDTAKGWQLRENR
jgi:hypothetical protein